MTKRVDDAMRIVFEKLRPGKNQEQSTEDIFIEFITSVDGADEHEVGACSQGLNTAFAFLFRAKLDFKNLSLSELRATVNFMMSWRIYSGSTEMYKKTAEALISRVPSLAHEFDKQDTLKILSIMSKCEGLHSEKGFQDARSALLVSIPSLAHEFDEQDTLKILSIMSKWEDLYPEKSYKDTFITVMRQIANNVSEFNMDDISEKLNLMSEWEFLYQEKGYQLTALKLISKIPERADEANWRSFILPLHAMLKWEPLYQEKSYKDACSALLARIPIITDRYEISTFVSLNHMTEPNWKPLYQEKSYKDACSALIDRIPNQFDGKDIPYALDTMSRWEHLYQEKSYQDATYALITRIPNLAHEFGRNDISNTLSAMSKWELLYPKNDYQNALKALLTRIPTVAHEFNAENISETLNAMSKWAKWHQDNYQPILKHLYKNLYHDNTYKKAGLALIDRIPAVADRFRGEDISNTLNAMLKWDSLEGDDKLIAAKKSLVEIQKQDGMPRSPRALKDNDAEFYAMENLLDGIQAYGNKKQKEVGVIIKRMLAQHRLRANALPVVAQAAVASPLLSAKTVEAKSANNEVALANTKSLDNDHVVQLDGCVLGARDGDKLVAGITCHTKDAQIIIFPKESDIKLASPEDKFVKESCRPVEFNGRPSIHCEGEQSNIVYTPEVFEPPLERINSLLMLSQVGLHLGKKLYHWLQNSSSEKNSAALSQVVPITTEQKTIWIALIIDIETRLRHLSNTNKAEDELRWVRHILDDRKEEYQSLQQKPQASLDDVTAMTENLKALQAELELMMDPVSNTNSGDKQSDVRSVQKESVSENSSPRPVNTALLSHSAKQAIGFQSSIRQRFFKEISQVVSMPLPVHAMNSTMVNATSIQQPLIGGR